MTNDSVCEHLSASGLEGTIAVVACDKPPVGTLAGILEHNRPAIILSDGPIHSGLTQLQVNQSILSLVFRQQAVMMKLEETSCLRCVPEVWQLWRYVYL